MLDYVFGLLTPIQWDAWRNWIVAGGGLIALVIAARTYAQNSRHRREEQARLVYSSVVSLTSIGAGQSFEVIPEASSGGGFHASAKLLSDGDGYKTNEAIAKGPVVQVVLSIENCSKEVIGPIRVRLVPLDGSWADSPGYVIAVMAPNSSKTVSLVGNNELPWGTPILRGSIVFRDSSGQWWHRAGSDPIERVHDDPKNPQAVTGVFEERRTITLGNGYAFDHPDTKVTLGTRLRRARRRVTGKSPIP